MRHTRSVMALAIAHAMLAAPAFAQDVTAAAVPEPSQEASSKRDETVKELDRVVVTATRRETSLLDTPISITSLSGEQLDSLNIQDASNLSRAVPGLQIRDNGIDGQGSVDINIRGIGNSNFIETGEPNVSFNIDGVYTPRPQATLQLFNDVQRVEVSRGPQGTLAGRNATAGSINVIPNRPSTEQVEGWVDVAAGTDNGKGLRWVFNLPLGEKFAVRAAYSAYERDSAYKLVRDETVNNYIEQLTGGGLSDGNPLTNIDQLPLNFNTLGQNPDGGFLPYFETRYGRPDDDGVGSYGSKDFEAYRLSALLQPTDNFSWYVTYEGYKNNALGAPMAPDCDRADCEQHFSPSQVAQADGRTAFLSFRGKMDQDIENVRSVIQYDIPGLLTIKYTYGRSDFQQTVVQDADGGAAIELGFVDDPWKNDSRVNELQLSSNGDGPFNWVAGYFDFREHTSRTFGVSFFQFGWAVFPNPNYLVETKAAYFDATYEFSDQLSGFAGIRHSNDRKSNRGARQYGLVSQACASAVSASPLNEAGGGPFFHAGIAALQQPECLVANNESPDSHDSFNDFRIGLTYELSDDLKGYASVSTGHKAKLQEQRILVERYDPERLVIPVKTESLVNYELGLKGSALENRFNFSSALFFMDYKDKQEAQFYNFGDRDCDLNSNGILDGGPTGAEAALGCGTIAGEQFDLLNPIDVNDTQFSDQIEYAVVNAPKVQAYGLELEGSAAIGKNGLLAGFFTYTHARYKEFVYSHVVGCPNDNLPWCAPHDVAGNTPRSTPDFTLSLNYTHYFTLANGFTIVPTVGAQYRGKYYLTPENVDGIDPSLITQASFLDGSGQGNTNESRLYSDRQDASVTAYFNVTFSSPASTWEMDIFGSNIFDEKVISHIRIDTANTPLVVTEEPAQFGLRMRYRF